ncbi:hypothetical protein ACJRO7_035403 [Eucalyptus globulus]|uniref:ABC transporter B family member 15-like n=1 Tax=Eucalyptus globulus TaxID=34317 RepID=A0ABD3JAZ4_EUCGL
MSGVVKTKKMRRIVGPISSIFKHLDAADRWLMALGLIGAVGDGISTPFVLLLSSRLMNNIGNALSLGEGQFSRVIDEDALSLVYVACGLFYAAFLGVLLTRTGERQASRMRSIYLRAVLRQDVGYFDLNVTSTSEVVTSVSNDSLVIQDALSVKVPSFVMNTSLFVGSYIAALLLQWRLALVSFPFVVLLVIPGLIYGRTLMGLARRVREEYNKAGTIAEQVISSIRTVYAFVGESKTMSDFSGELEGSVRSGLKQGLAKGLAIGSNGVVYGIWAFVAYYSSRMVMYHGAEGGTVYAVGAGLAVGGLAFGTALSNLKYFAEAIYAVERITEVIDRVPKIDTNNLEGRIVEKVSGEIEFKHVEFAYPSRPNIIFKDFCLTIPAGKSIALVGGSGSGKSTVISLLQRFYDPLNGEILLDGVPIDKLQLKGLRSQMGLVSQEPTLFATTIKENILFGKEDATMEEVVEAAKASNAHNFISQMPQGYDTQVGERGIQMSGGQKQRIAIARAIIKSPRILLLDEATSALDMESERIVQEALEKVAVGRTTIVVTHRLSTIQNADVIAVVQNGQVMESGSHQELIRFKGGIYSSLVHLQQMESKKTQDEAQVISTRSPSSPKIDSTRDPTASIFGSANNAESAQMLAERRNTREGLRFQTSLLRRLLSFSRPEWKQVAMACVSAVLGGAIQPVFAFMMGSMISVFFLTDHDEIKEKTRTYTLCFAGFFMISLLINTSEHYNFAYVGEYLTKRIREMMLAKILTFEVGWFDQDKNSSGAVCSRLAKDINVVRSLVGDQMSLLVQAISAVTIACIMGLVIAWRLAIAMIAIQPLIILCFYGRKTLLKGVSQKAIEAQNECSKLAAEAVSSHRMITAFSSQEKILKMLKKAQEGPRRESKRQSWFAGVGLGASQSLTNCTMAFDFWYGGKLVTQGYITYKEVFETFLILLSTGKVIADAGGMTTDIASLQGLGSHEPADPQGFKPENISGHVEVRDVDFAYPARPDAMILKGFSIDIEAGKSTALVGQSGSGKSTIISLIERFYDPLRGTIKIDGREIRSYHLRSLRQHIALVSQEPTLFAGTVKENIIFGVSPAVDEMEILEAARVANAHGFISGLKDGYDTWCGDKGVQLSGGQKQRVAIARAILKNPSVLLLDEATSALDGQAERMVQDALEGLMVGRTSVVVAHRLSTIHNCAVIAVLEKGKLVEKGTHFSLLAKGPGGAYYSLASLHVTT